MKFTSKRHKERLRIQALQQEALQHLQQGYLDLSCEALIDALTKQKKLVEDDQQQQIQDRLALLQKTRQDWCQMRRMIQEQITLSEQI